MKITKKNISNLLFIIALLIFISRFFKDSNQSYWIVGITIVAIILGFWSKSEEKNA